jgi:3-(3-hydroxy-phenyl)propionate hydroxylase
MNATVVVVGAGPTGVTAATLLASYGVEVVVLDRWTEVYQQPRAVHLDDEVYRILAQLGLADEFATISRPAEGLRLQDARHRVFAEFHRAATTGRHGYPQANMFDQPELEALLRTHLVSQACLTFRGGVEVHGVRQDDPASIRVDFTDRTTGAREGLSAAYVLGCDGANSVVRSSIGSTMQDLRFEQRWLVVDVNTDRNLGLWEGVHQVCDTHRAATYMRISDRRYRWEFQLRDGEASGDFASLSALRPLLEPWIGDAANADLELVRSAEYTFRAQVADRWRSGRIFLLGDAAHLTPPFIGQGMGTGLRDAANLSWKLAHVIQGLLPESVLDSYEQERRPHAIQMIRLAITIGTAMTRGGRAGDVLRRLIAPRLHLVPGLRERVLDSATPRLRRSPLVVRGRRWPRLSGTLCPNLPVSDGRRFDDLAAGRFAMVTRQPLPQGPGGVVEIQVRAGEPLHDWLVRGGATAALVRPDGVVMVASRRVDAVLTALEALQPHIMSPT